MTRITRRQTLNIISTTITAATLGTTLHLLTHKPPTITHENYTHTLTTLNNLGYDTDPTHTFYQPNSHTLIVYLPDIHTISYIRQQRRRIKTLDDAIDFNLIGLEGLTGTVNTTKTIRLLEKKERYWHDNTLPTTIKDPTIDYTIKPSDPDHITLQKLAVHLDDATEWGTNGFTNNPTFQHDLRTKHPRSQAFMTFSKQLMRLATLTNRRETLFPGEDPISQYLFTRAFRHTQPRITAPGLLYATLPTRAPKRGVETETLDRHANTLIDAHELHLGTQRLTHHLRKVNDAFHDVEHHYQHRGTPEEQHRYHTMKAAFTRYITHFVNYVNQMRAYRDELLTTLPEHLRDAVPTHTYDEDNPEPPTTPVYEDVVVHQRSNHWVNNLKDHGTVLLIAGYGHTDSITNAAHEHHTSLITLPPLPNFLVLKTPPPSPK